MSSKKQKDAAAAAAVETLDHGDLTNNPVVQAMCKQAADDAVRAVLANPAAQPTPVPPPPVTAPPDSELAAMQAMVRDAATQVATTLRHDAAALAQAQTEGIVAAIHQSLQPLVDKVDKELGEGTAKLPSKEATKEWYEKLDKKEQNEVHSTLGLVRGPTGLWTCLAGHDLELIINGGGWGVAAGLFNLISKGTLPLGVWKILNLLSVL